MGRVVNHLRDYVAIAGAESTGFVADNTPRSRASLVAEACVAVLRSCGVERAEIDGLCGSVPTAPVVQEMLGLGDIMWFANPPTPFINQVVTAAQAVYSGTCNVVLAYHSSYRLPWNTPASLRDPFRASPGSRAADGSVPLETIGGPIAYASWAARYDYEHGDSSLGRALVAVNGRSNAALNPLAAKSAPMTIADHHESRLVRWPLRLLDMDVPVDGADAFVITTAERARDLALPPVLINACAVGAAARNTEEGTAGLDATGQSVVARALRERSDIWLDGADLLYPYDGFTSIAIGWLEALGCCAPGEGSAYLAANWDERTSRLSLGGRVPVNTHGGALSEGGTQGSGHVREAVHQLQGVAGPRQASRARTALLTGGGFFTNAQGLTLRAAD
jgi:acetyl-CoA acetyltransferase